jgi:hypothetical protein
MKIPDRFPTHRLVCMKKHAIWIPEATAVDGGLMKGFPCPLKDRKHGLSTSGPFDGKAHRPPFDSAATRFLRPHGRGPGKRAAKPCNKKTQGRKEIKRNFGGGRRNHWFRSQSMPAGQKVDVIACAIPTGFPFYSYAPAL